MQMTNVLVIHLEYGLIFPCFDMTASFPSKMDQFENVNRNHIFLFQNKRVVNTSWPRIPGFVDCPIFE